MEEKMYADDVFADMHQFLECTIPSLKLCYLFLSSKFVPHYSMNE